MTTKEFFEAFRRLAPVQQRSYMSLADSSQMIKSFNTGLYPENPLIAFITRNPQVNSRYLAKSLIGMGA